MAETEKILNFLEYSFGNLSRQYDWDNSSRQLYSGDREILRLAVALDPSESVINKAIETGCEILITHHPLFFGSLKQLDAQSVLGSKVFKAIRAGLDIVSYHTSFDLADYSLNDFLPQKLDANVIGTLKKEGGDPLFKFVVFVPADYAEKIVSVMDRCGGGHIGNYSGCTFRTEGTGTFRPMDGTTPFIGKKGQFEQVNECRVETIIPSSKLQRLVDEVKQAHPYEEVAHDIYRLEMDKSWGIGRVCSYDENYTLEKFLSKISDKLNINDIQHNWDNTGLEFNKFAVVTGSGASMWKACLKKGIKVLLTGDMKHHDALDAFEAGVCIVDAGHFATEKIFMDYLAEILEEKFGLEVIKIKEDSAIKNWRK